MTFQACFGIVIVLPDEWLPMVRCKGEHFKAHYCLTSTWHVHYVPFHKRELVPVPAPDQNSPRLTVPSLLTMGPTC